MSDPQQLEKELREYLDKESNLRREDRLAFLKIVFHKHLEMSKLEHSISYRDLFDIISGAKQAYNNFSFPLAITGKHVESNETANVAMVESFISYLSRMNLLKKVVKFDYTKGQK